MVELDDSVVESSDTGTSSDLSSLGVGEDASDVVDAVGLTGLGAFGAFLFTSRKT